MKNTFKDLRTKQYLAHQHPGDWMLMKFFFFEQGERRERDFSELLRTILSHLLSQNRDLVSIVSPIYLQCNREGDIIQDIWSQESLMEALNAIAGQTLVLTRMLIFVDALDECLGDHRKQLDFLLSWVNTAAQAGHLSKICLSSRQLNEIQVRLGRLHGLSIHEWTAHDISAYVTSRLEEVVGGISLTGGTFQRTLEKALIKEVVRKAQGVFIWVKLVADDLTEGLEAGDTDKELKIRLANIPNELVDLYERIVDKISISYLPDTVNYFQIIGCATQPLSLEEFCMSAENPNDAISCEVLDNERAAIWLDDLCSRMRLRLQSRCQGLIQIRNDALGDFAREYGNARDAVTFLHLTVKQYIFNDKDRWSRLLARAKLADCIDGNISLMAMYLRKLKTGSRYWPGFMRRTQHLNDSPMEDWNREKLEDSNESEAEEHVSTRRRDLDLEEEYDSQYDSDEEKHGESRKNNAAASSNREGNGDDDDNESVDSDEVISEKAPIYGYFVHARRSPRSQLYPQKLFYQELHRFCKEFDKYWSINAYLGVSKYEWVEFDPWEPGQGPGKQMDRGRLAIFHGMATLMEETLETERLPSALKFPPLLFALEGAKTFGESDMPHYINLITLLLRHDADPNDHYDGWSMWDYTLRAFEYRSADLGASPMISLLEAMVEKTDPTVLAAGCLTFLNMHEKDYDHHFHILWLRDFVRNLVKKGIASYPRHEDTNDESPTSSDRSMNRVEWTPQAIYGKIQENMKEWELWRAKGRPYETPSCYGVRMIRY
jgi:hypothetical protein